MFDFMIHHVNECFPIYTAGEKIKKIDHTIGLLGLKLPVTNTPLHARYDKSRFMVPQSHAFVMALCFNLTPAPARRKVYG
jgi:hypothetical protein